MSVDDASFIRPRAPQPSRSDFFGDSMMPAHCGTPASSSMARPVVAHEAIAIIRAAVRESDRVHHAVAVERMVATDRAHHWILGVAQVHAVELRGIAPSITSRSSASYSTNVGFHAPVRYG